MECNNHPGLPPEPLGPWGRVGRGAHNLGVHSTYLGDWVLKRVVAVDLSGGGMEQLTTGPQLKGHADLAEI